MWIALAVGALLTQAPAAANDSKPIKLAAPGLRISNMSETDASFYSDHYAQQLKLFGLSVVTANDISALLGLERQKELLGCNEQAQSCIAELAGALGAEGLVTGHLAKIGPLYQVNLNILSAKDGASLSVFSSRVQGEEPLLEELNRAAKMMAREVYLKLGRPLPESLLDRPSPLRQYAWVPAVGGVVLGGVGGFLFYQSQQRVQALRSLDTQAVGNDPRAFAAAGQSEQTAGVALMGAGGAAIVAAGIMYLVGKPAPVTGTVTVAQGGAQVSLGGTFP